MPRSTLPVEITNVKPMTNEVTMSPLSSQLVVVLRHASLVSNARFISVHFASCDADGVTRRFATPKVCARQEYSHSNLRPADLAVAPFSRPGVVDSPDRPACFGGRPHRPQQVPLCSPKRRENSRPLSTLLGKRELRSQDRADPAAYCRRQLSWRPQGRSRRPIRAIQRTASPPRPEPALARLYRNRAAAPLC